MNTTYTIPMKFLYSFYALTLALRFGCSWELLRFLILGFLLLTLSVIDLKTMTLPDKLVFASGLSALLRIPSEGFSAIPDALLGACCVAIPLFVFVLLAERVMQREVMGGGDIKLLAALGLHFGAVQTMVLLFLACCIGIPVAAAPKFKGKEIPFGPFLSLAAWGCILFGDFVLQWYFSLFFY